MSAVIPTTTGDVIRVEVHDGTGIDVMTVEGEDRLVRLVGPTGFLLMRLLIRRVDQWGGNAECFELDDLARSLGVRPQKVRDAMKRAQRYDLAAVDRGSLVVYRRWHDRRPAR